jgi:hypothetical protein
MSPSVSTTIDPSSTTTPVLTATDSSTSSTAIQIGLPIGLASLALVVLGALFFSWRQRRPWPIRHISNKEAQHRTECAELDAKSPHISQSSEVELEATEVPAELPATPLQITQFQVKIRRYQASSNIYT